MKDRSSLVRDDSGKVVGVRHATSAWGHPVVHSAEDRCVMCTADGVPEATGSATCGGCGAISDEECSPSCLSWEELAEARKRL